MRCDVTHTDEENGKLSSSLWHSEFWLCNLSVCSISGG